MPIKVGQIEAIFRYPVKSMRGEQLSTVMLGWHGLNGDRRFAFRRLNARDEFPWLTASKLPDLISYTPLRHEDGNGEALPSSVRTPEGQEMPLFSEALAEEIGQRFGAPVHEHFGAQTISAVRVVAHPLRQRRIGQLHYFHATH